MKRSILAYQPSDPSFADRRWQFFVKFLSMYGWSSGLVGRKPMPREVLWLILCPTGLYSVSVCVIHVSEREWGAVKGHVDFVYCGRFFPFQSSCESICFDSLEGPRQGSAISQHLFPSFYSFLFQHAVYNLLQFCSTSRASHNREPYHTLNSTT